MSDCISREQAIKSAECIIKSNSVMKTFCILRMLKELPSVPKNDDLISRQAVNEMAYDMSEIDGEHFTEPYMVVNVEDIQKLPPVNPQEPKTGHWILYEECAIWGRTYKCSECKTMIDIKTNYCPYCGAKMVGVNNDR